VQYYTPIIPDTGEVEIGRMTVFVASPGKKSVRLHLNQ
jgi:hypothetical protein